MTTASQKNAIHPAGSEKISYVGSLPATMSYDQVKLSVDMIKQLKELKKRQINKHFPWQVTIAFAALIALISLALIALQIYLVVAANTNDAYAGFWGGAIGIFYSALLLIAGLFKSNASNAKFLTYKH